MTLLQNAGGPLAVACSPAAPSTPMQPTRIVTLASDPSLQVLTATARGMIEGNFIRAAQRAFTELMSAVVEAGQHPAVRSRLGLLPDRPASLNDARCRYVAGVIFGHDLSRQIGMPERPELPLSGSLAWWPLAAGRYAVFTHQGPYDTLRSAWMAIYDDWLPHSGERLQLEVPPFELNLRTPDQVPAQALLTEIWLPLV